MKKIRLLLGTLVMMTALFVSCATSFPITVSHPPNMDTSGIDRLVVMPIEGSGNRGQLASTLTSIFREKISETGKFKLVDPVAYKSNEGTVDAILMGEVIGYTVQDSSRQVERSRRDKNGNVIEYVVTVYDREVSIEFTYRIVRDRDGSIIGERRISDTTTSSNDNSSKLPSGDSMAKSLAVSSLKNFNQEIVPWTSQEKLTLDEEKSKDKAVKKRMKEAKAMVKEGNMQLAMDTYAAIYAETKSLAAGYNHALLAQALDGPDAGISLMSALVDATGYPKARTELARLEGFRSETVAAAANQAGTSAQELALKNASAELLAALPANSRVSLLNVSASARDRVDVLIREITAVLVAGGITVLDRQDLSVINAEKQYQSSGEVGDDSYVSIGHMLGVETIVMFSIAGSGNQRKLTIKSVSVETGEVLYNALTEI